MENLPPLAAGAEHEPEAAAPHAGRGHSAGTDRGETGAVEVGQASAPPGAGAAERGAGVYQEPVRTGLGDVEVAQQADERGEHAARVGLVHGADRLVDRVGVGHGDRSNHLGVDPGNPRSTMKRRRI